MLDQPASKTQSGVKTAGPRLDLQKHLADLEAAGLLVRIDRPINKDTELIPLVRWQFIGGMPEDQRRAFLFTNVIDSKGRKYDMPVVVGALASSPAIYALGMGRPVEEIGEAWMAAIAHPIPPVATNDAPCQEVVITGAALILRHATDELPAHQRDELGVLVDRPVDADKKARGFQVGQMLLQVETRTRRFRAACRLGGRLIEHGWIVSQQMVLTLARPASKLAANGAAGKPQT